MATKAFVLIETVAGKNKEGAGELRQLEEVKSVDTVTGPYDIIVILGRKTVTGKSIAVDSSLDDVLQMTERKQFAAEPVDGKDLTSPWLTGRPKAIRAAKKILGQSEYEAHAGCYTGGANGVYWMDIMDKRPDGLVVISN